MDGTIVFNQTFLGQQVRNVTVWNNLVADAEELQDLADALRGTWVGGLAPDLLTTWSLDSVTFIFNESAPIFSLDVPFTAGALAGSATDDPNVSQASLLVSTQFFGEPPNRGRVYFTGLGDNDLGADGRWTVAIKDSAQDMVAGWADGVSTVANTYFLRIGRRTPAGILTITSPVTTVVGRRTPAIQRRRRLGEGI